MGFSMFKLPRYSVFTYTPRYYDAEKERREKRRRELRMDSGKEPFDDSKPGNKIKGSFNYIIERRKTQQKTSRLRFIIILSTLALLAYLILEADLSRVVMWFNQ